MDILAQLQSLGVHAASMTSDSRRVRANALFVAYSGEKQDGRQYIPQAIAAGASGVLYEAANFVWDASWHVPHVAVSQLKQQVGVIADQFYGQPSQSLWMVGVTGTNGKTSCSQWIAQAMQTLGRKTAVVGTLGNGFPNALSHTINTTPDPIQLHGMLSEYCQAGAGGVAMEVSSHGLDQGRVNGVAFDVAVLTNLTRDHLDYHGDMESYAAAKRKLFDWQTLHAAVLNADDAFGQTVLDDLQARGQRVLTYGIHRGDVQAYDVQCTSTGLSMIAKTPQGERALQVGVLGQFNVYNVLAVLATLLESNVLLDDAIAAVSQLKPVAGRMQTCGGQHGQPLVVIDYAHTPDALENVLSTLKAQAKGQVICVFGCGGNRDQGKRPLMGEVASRLADVTIITTDNPRDETPETIAEAIAQGVKANYEMILDRAVAIQRAIQLANGNDIVLIAGKGHEDYQEVRGVKLPFSDMAVAMQALEGVAA